MRHSIPTWTNRISKFADFCVLFGEYFMKISVNILNFSALWRKVDELMSGFQQIYYYLKKQGKRGKKPAAGFFCQKKKTFSEKKAATGFFSRAFFEESRGSAHPCFTRCCSGPWRTSSRTLRWAKPKQRRGRPPTWTSAGR